MKIKTSFLYIFFLIIIFLCVISYEELVFETEISLNKCLTQTIPSLYGAMILACLVTESRIHCIIGKLFSPISRYVFKIPHDIFSVFLLSNISGYPVGAKILYNLKKNREISSEEFKRYCCFCFSSGPAFVSGAAICRIYGSSNIGVIIFISTFFSNLVIAFISGLKLPYATDKKTNLTSKSPADIITNSVNNASSGIFQMCTMIVAFSVFKIFLINSGFISLVSGLFSGISLLSYSDSVIAVLSFFEITNITEFKTCDPNVISIMAALYSFGGVCVFMQVLSISKSELDIKLFLKYRILSSFISYITSRILCYLFLKEIAVTASSFRIYSDTDSAMPSAILILMSIMLIKYSSENKNSLIAK